MGQICFIQARKHPSHLRRPPCLHAVRRSKAIPSRPHWFFFLKPFILILQKNQDIYTSYKSDKFRVRKLPQNTKKTKANIAYLTLDSHTNHCNLRSTWISLPVRKRCHVTNCSCDRVLKGTYWTFLWCLATQPNFQTTMSS